MRTFTNYYKRNHIIKTHWRQIVKWNHKCREGDKHTKKGRDAEFFPHLINKDPQTPSGPEVSEEENHPEGVQNAHFNLRLNNFAHNTYGLEKVRENLIHLYAFLKYKASHAFESKQCCKYIKRTTWKLHQQLRCNLHVDILAQQAVLGASFPWLQRAWSLWGCCSSCWPILAESCREAWLDLALGLGRWSWAQCFLHFGLLF